jgi:hypothetical protein
MRVFITRTVATAEGILRDRLHDLQSFNGVDGVPNFRFMHRELITNIP